MTGIDDLRWVENADVYRGEVHAAQLVRTSRGTRFAYLNGYHGPDVATTLPVGTVIELPGGALPPFFSGLLPEGRRLTALRGAVKTSLDDELTLLLAVGGDLIGDVRVLPAGTDPASTAEPLLTGDLDLSRLRSDAGLIDRVGLPGVQEKASGAMISLPVSVGGVSSIVKLDPPEYPGVVVNEHYFLGLARHCGLAAATSVLMQDANGERGLVVERFDRVMTDDGVTRLAVEDACQLLNRYPAAKYRVSSEEVVQAMTRVAAASQLAARDAFRLLLFAWLTGDGDVHAKNLSMIRRGDEWQVAPAYDVPSTLPYGDHAMALSLGGRTSGLTRRHWEDFGRAVGVPPRAVSSSIERLVDGTAGLLGDVRDGVLGLNPNATATLVRQLKRRRNDMARR